MTRIITVSTLLLSLALTTTTATAHTGLDPKLDVVVDRDAVRAKLVEQRAANLARFRSYYRGKVYPSNVYKPGELNVWRDEDGHFCAAATIIRSSGEVALVDKVAEQSNFIRLADVKQGPLMDWILTSGFTQEEIVMIQKPFNPVTVKPPVIDPSLRAKETARLLKVYKDVDAKLVKAQQLSLERAVDRLMAHPELAQQLLNG